MFQKIHYIFLLCIRIFNVLFCLNITTFWNGLQLTITSLSSFSSFKNYLSKFYVFVEALC